MLVLILPATIAAWAWAFFAEEPARPAFLRALVAFGTATVLITELVSVWQGVARPDILACWAVVLVLGICMRRRADSRKKGASGVDPIRPAWFDALCVATMVGIASVIAWVALVSPPNSADAMSYHLPRVIHWIQRGAVEFFPTSHLAEIMLQPVAEYMMLHLYLLSGGDRFTNLVQFGGYVGCAIGVSSIAGALGLRRRGQVLAALFSATLPNGILQASGAKNDYLLAFWLVCMVLFAIRWVERRSVADLVFLGLATGLALGTKGTAYLFAPPFLAAAALATGKYRTLRARDWMAAALAIGCGIIAVNLPQYARNYELSGSPLGFDSAQADGFFRWRNESLGWKPTVSNLLRNTSEQLGARSESWNQNVFGAVIRIHAVLGIDSQDPGTTWRWSEFRPPRNSNHEADANNRWHLLIAVIAALVAAYGALTKNESGRRWALYCIGPLGGFLGFCFYLKWQPFFSRLLLPLFVISSPLAAMAMERLRPLALQSAICLLLVSNARLALFENWTRPLEGAKSVRSTPRHINYFNDMVTWDNRASYLRAVDQVAASTCTSVGVDVSVNHIEYPFQALLLERNPAVRFMHTGVANPSARFAGPENTRPCAVLCLDCAGREDKVSAYNGIGKPRAIGRFLLFLPEQ